MATVVGILSAVLGGLCLIAYRRMLAMDRECTALTAKALGEIEIIKRRCGERETVYMERFSRGDGHFGKLERDIRDSTEASNKLAREVSELLGFLRGRQQLGEFGPWKG